MSLVARLKYAFEKENLLKRRKKQISVLAVGVNEPNDLLVLEKAYGVPRNFITFQNYFKPTLSQAENIGFKCLTKCKKKYDLVIIEIPTDKKEALGVISYSLENIKKNGLLICDGLKTSGIESVIKKLDFLDLSVISKAHGKLLYAPLPSEIPQFVYDWRSILKLSLNQDKFMTRPGMFSYRKIDSGSRLLGSLLPKNITGDVADLCSGWGYLSSILANHNKKIKNLHLFEANYSALAASKTNVTDCRASFHWEDVMNLENLGLKFDFIVCNPPFHSKTNYDIKIGRHIITVGRKTLKLNGSFWMVANKHLPYEKHLKLCFQNVDKVIENSFYKIFKATQPNTNS